MPVRWGLGLSLVLHAVVLCVLAGVVSTFSPRSREPVVTLYFSMDSRPMTGTPSPVQKMGAPVVKPVEDPRIPSVPKASPAPKPEASAQPLLLKEAFSVACAHAGEQTPALVKNPEPEASASTAKEPSAGTVEASQGLASGTALAMAGGRDGAMGIKEKEGFTGFGQGGEDGPGSTQRPRFLHYVEPEYPDSALRFNKRGIVWLEARIDENGKLSSVKITKGAGFGMDEAAVAALESSSFVPARLNGKNVAAVFSIPYRFDLRYVRASR